MSQKKVTFQQKLSSVLSDLRDLELDSGVLSNTALFGFLYSASFSLKSAFDHIDEYSSRYDLSSED